MLSNHYLCANKNSQYTQRFGSETVVNCFQIIIFVLTRTAIKVIHWSKVCCELLSNHYLCANKNSRYSKMKAPKGVVNCFQIIIFVLTRTAYHSIRNELGGCELLSNHYLCANKNSSNSLPLRLAIVVNCFQIIIFVLTRTANKSNTLKQGALWIAFKSLSLC